MKLDFAGAHLSDGNRSARLDVGAIHQQCECPVCALLQFTAINYCLTCLSTRLTLGINREHTAVRNVRIQDLPEAQGLIFGIYVILACGRILNTVGAGGKVSDGKCAASLCLDYYNILPVSIDEGQGLNTRIA